MNKRLVSIRVFYGQFVVYIELVMCNIVQYFARNDISSALSPSPCTMFNSPLWVTHLINKLSKNEKFSV
jgi:hypothetical protein